MEVISEINSPEDNVSSIGLELSKAMKDFPGVYFNVSFNNNPNGGLVYGNIKRLGSLNFTINSPTNIKAEFNTGEAGKHVTKTLTTNTDAIALITLLAKNPVEAFKILKPAKTV